MAVAEAGACMPELAYVARRDVSWCRIGEPPPDPISEAELSLIWAEQRYPAGALATPSGQPVEVVFPGRKGGSAGPDFRDAVLRLEGRERRGDVELHVRASYFRSHGHHLDPAYDSLALHVVYLADDGAETVLHSGGRTPVAAFAPWVQQRSADLQRWLAGPALWQEPCADAVARLGPQHVREVLQAAGRERFEQRALRLKELGQRLGRDEALWRTLFDLVGQGGDREGFRRLAAGFPCALALEIWREHGRRGLESGLLAAAGLAPPAPELMGPLPPALKPALAGSGRPANRPQRRLAAIAALVERAEGDLGRLALASVAAAERAPELVTAWQVPGALGAEKAAEVVLNLVLPLALDEPVLREKALALATALAPPRAYGKTEFLERHLRRTDGGRLTRSALEQQGLLGLLTDWCSQGGCGRCPLS